MRHVPILALLALVLAGCSGPSAPSTPGTGGPPTDPDDLFTGEPTPAVIEIMRSVASAPVTLSATSPKEHATDPESPLVANIHLQRFASNGRVDYQRHFKVDVPRYATNVEFPVELPADQRYKITVTIYDPLLKSDEGNYILSEIATKQDIAVMANHTNRVTIATSPLEYEITAPKELYSGGDLRQINIEIPREYDINDITRFYGLNPWDANGVKAFWGANAGHAGRGIPNTGWMDSGNAPVVEEPTPLYYQFRLCIPVQLDDGLHFMCAYVPDVEAGEPLGEILIYPEPGQN